MKIAGLKQTVLHTRLSIAHVYHKSAETHFGRLMFYNITMHLKHSIILFLTIVLLATLGCTTQKQEVNKERGNKASRQSEETNRPKREGQFVGVKLEGSKKMNGKKLASSFSFPSMSRFEGKITIANQDQILDHHLVTLLLDYKQSEMIIDGESKLTSKLSVDSYSDNSISFKTKTISKGFHDLTLLDFVKPDNLKLNSEERVVNNPIIKSIRSNLFVDSSTAPTLDYSIKATGQILKEKAPIILLSKKINYSIKSKESLWIKEKIKRGGQVNYFIHLYNGFPSANTKTFAVIPFLDFKQIPIYKDETEPKKFAKLKYKDKASIPASFTAPQEEGLYDLQVVIIANPYKKLSEDPEKRMAVEDDEKIEYSYRVRIVVE